MNERPARAPRSGQRRLLALCAGFVTWFILLCVVYATHAWGCQAGWSTGGLRTALAVTVLAGVAGLALWIWRRADGMADQSDYLPAAIRLATGAAVLASIASLLPPLLLTPCG